MDLLYSVTLIIALVAGVLACLMGLLTLLNVDARKSIAVSPWQRLVSRRAAFVVVALGAGSLVISVVVHLLWGHGPTSPAPMSFDRLVSEHEAFPVAAIFLAFGFVLNALALPRMRT